jgi:uncharacterized protein (DUF885 family)
MNRLFPIFLTLAFAVLAAAPNSHETLNTLIDKEWQYQLQEFPEMATAIGDNRFNDRLMDFSAAAYQKRADHNKTLLAELKKIPQEGLTGNDKLNLALMLQSVQVEVDGARFKEWEMPANQVNGPHLEYPTLSKDMPFNTLADYENYLKRLRALPQMFEQLTANMRLGMKDGLMPPRYLLENVASESDDIAKAPVKDSLWTEPLKHFPAGISIQDQKRLEDEIGPTVSAIVLPAYAKFARFVKEEYAPKGRQEYGVGSLPEGAARYRQNIHEETTTDMSPEELHKLGLKQVQEIDAQMLAIAKTQGFNDLKSFNQHIHDDRALYGVSGAQILALYQKYADQMYAKLPLYFGRLPKNKLVVTPMEEFRAPHSYPADYSIGAGDGSRPGHINVNEYDPTHRLMLNVEAIAYHEGIPGHHLQFSIAQELQDIPPFRRFSGYNSYCEGWALYSETLAHEMGFYQDPYSEYGRLQNLMWRSIRLVVDTGVHSQHWTRQQMVDFFHAHTAMDDQNISTEVDRYIAWPGQALGYKLGEMTILRMRAKAKEKLKDKFDIRAFNDAVLDGGPLPLSVLETKLDNWIASH